ncbi:thiol-disulfide oxidoreductase DCC family protein [Gloeocapsa sp. PCC 73106]|uniref:thiol-disulfide oxidoreductase DCC family protein n=1 Tax=Gloeocapsa sp. PCC 73106 TaxID=102232 RepID=UPI0002ABC535|nr:DCC1-like thiol-disulfide oxidoreductase family protein [Gloeocapsa sp. PCC 73106]ELR98685.1 hypothetical protein GLO73106DRAFT_00025230 [Gloeocapsa sp. PCC 73106]
MPYYLIYDGNCNLCVNFTKALEQIDQGKTFRYTPMQDREMLDSLGIKEQDCQKGMILIDSTRSDRRWQGSDAAEAITSLLPMGDPLIDLYRSLPAFKWLGDRLYDQVRDNRYQWFGKRETTYVSNYPFDCQCQPK